MLTRGGGIKLVITTHNPPSARLLDVTRLISRAGQQATGVDRVEMAYLEHLLSVPDPLFGLVRTRYGFALLDRTGLQALSARLAGKVPWGAIDGLSRVARGLSAPRRQAEADCRRLSIARSLPARLPRMLKQNLPHGLIYLNVGHSNLTNRVLVAVRQAVSGRNHVMLHDTIPLDFPQHQRPGSPERFRGIIRRVRKMADLVICNSEQTRLDVLRHMTPLGAPPKMIVAHLGVKVADPEPMAFPPGWDKKRPYFCAIGTIEPRKNISLLLDIWDSLEQDLPATEMPQLLLLGRRGWESPAVLERLDRSPLRNKHLFELPDQNDGQVSTALIGSAGLLFPSMVEGFGLPPVEAALLGVPVVCNDLAIYREIIGDIPVYADINDRYLWENTIKKLAVDRNTARDAGKSNPTGFNPPTWEQHFNTVLRVS